MDKGLKKDFRKAREEYQKREALKLAEAKKEYKMTPEEEKEALEYLKNPNLFEYLKNDFKAIGIVGEEINAISLFLFSITRKTDEPISAVLFGDSSSGKSYLLNSICSLIPDEDVMIITSASSKAFEYGTEDQLKHKFIIIQEIEGMKEVEPTIRLIQSEGRLARYAPWRKNDYGPVESDFREVECPACVITTTTWDSVHQENSTRIFELYLDQSQEHTERIQELEKKKATVDWKQEEKERTRLKNLHKNIQRLVMPYPVDIPYAKHIDFPTDSTRNRRDLPRFLKLIDAIASVRKY